MWFSCPSNSVKGNKSLHHYLEQLEAFVSNDGTVLHQGKVTLADAKLYNLFADKGFDDVVATRAAVAGYPKLSKIMNNFVSIPAIKIWIESRGPSMF